MSGEPGEPRGILDHEGERRLVAPRPVEPEPGHPEHDEIGPIGPERLVVETELVQHPWRVVLDDHIARRDESAHEIDAAWIAEVDRQALLVGVERGEDRAPLPEPILRLRHAADQASPVGPGRRFEVDHLCAEERQHVAGERARPVGRHVQDPQPLERRAPAWRRGRARSARGSRGERRVDRVLAEPGGRLRAAEGAPPRAGRAVADSPRRPAGSRRTSPARGSARTCVTFEPLAIGALGIRKADARSSTSSTVCSAIQASMVGASAVRSRKSDGSSIHSGCSTIDAEVEPLLPGPAPEPDQPVAGRPDARRRDEPASPHRSSELVVERHRVVGEAHRQRLEHRHVDELAARRRCADPPPGSRSRRRRRRATPRSGHRRTPAHGRVCPRASPTIAPDHACSVNSVAALSLQGPSSPNGVIDVTIRCGCARKDLAGRQRRVLRHRRAAGPDDGVGRRQQRLQRREIVRRSSPSTTTLCFDALRKLKSAPSASGGIAAPEADHRRSGSPSGDSTLMTSAPPSASSFVQ